MTTLLSMSDNTGSGNVLTFSAPVTWNSVVTNTAKILLYSPSQGQWIPCSYLSQPSPTTMLVDDVDEDGDCNAVIIVGQPDGLSANQPFQVATPIVYAP